MPQAARTIDIRRSRRRHAFAIALGIVVAGVLSAGAVLASAHQPKGSPIGGSPIGGSPIADAEIGAAAVSYNRDVRPILSDHCFQCHGPDSAARQADLRLDVREDALRDRDGFKAIDLENPADSEILFRIHTDDAELLMPPPAMKKPLSDGQKATLERWIREGAVYEPHWSLVPP